MEYPSLSVSEPAAVPLRNGPSEALGSDFYRSLLDNLYDGVYFVDLQRRITYWNSGATRLTGYAAEEVLGHSCADGILMHADESGKCLCKGSCPLVRTIGTGQPGEALVYLHHKQGHRVPVNVRATPLRNREGRIIGAVEIFSDASARVAALDKAREMEQMALIDPLTGVGNRRYTESFLGDRLAEFTRYGWSFGVLFGDVDHFKRFNDEFGHEVGDEVLRVVARSLKGALRSFDFVGRWGGEEFVVLCPNANLEQTVAIAERCRALVTGSQVNLGTGRISAVSLSLGATTVRAGDTANSILARADQLMYASKAAGRDRITSG